MMKVHPCVTHADSSKLKNKKNGLSNLLIIYSLKLHHERRPLSMKTDVIKKRQRYESTSTGSRKNGKKSKNDVSEPGSPTQHGMETLFTFPFNEQEPQQHYGFSDDLLPNYY